MNFAVCPHDGQRLKTDPSWRVGARPVVMRCLACGRRYALSDTGTIDADPEDGSARG